MWAYGGHKMEINLLKAPQIKSLGPGKHRDGNGLWLIKSSETNGSWSVRYSFQGERQSIGLGRIQEVSLKEARERAQSIRAKVRQGENPRAEKKAGKVPTFEAVARNYFDKNKSSWKGNGGKGRWFSPIELYALPKIGSLPITEIDHHQLAGVLEPIWKTKAPTAKKLIGRLSQIMTYARAYDSNIAPDVTKLARELLGKQQHKVQNHEALPHSEMPAFYQWLRDDLVSHVALKLLILTAARVTPICQMKAQDIADGTWTVPLEDMKSSRVFRVPLSRQAQEIVDRITPGSGFLFSSRRGKPLSDNALSKILRDNDIKAVPHGFRSSFRSWGEDAGCYNEQTLEYALDHRSAPKGGETDAKTRAAYVRTDRLEQRRVLMQDWADYLGA